MTAVLAQLGSTVLVRIRIVPGTSTGASKRAAPDYHGVVGDCAMCRQWPCTTCRHLGQDCTSVRGDLGADYLMATQPGPRRTACAIQQVNENDAPVVDLIVKARTQHLRARKPAQETPLPSTTQAHGLIVSGPPRELQRDHMSPTLRFSCLQPQPGRGKGEPRAIDFGTVLERQRNQPLIVSDRYYFLFRRTSPRRAAEYQWLRSSTMALARPGACPYGGDLYSPALQYLNE